MQFARYIAEFYESTNLFSLFSLSDKSYEKSDKVIGQLSPRATPVVTAADLLNVLNLDAQFSAAIVVKSNDKAVQVFRIPACIVDATRPADNTSPPVEVRRAAQIHQPNAKLEVPSLNDTVGDVVVQGPRWTMRDILSLEVVSDCTKRILCEALVFEVRNRGGKVVVRGCR
jgi:hypothetical protein